MRALGKDEKDLNLVIEKSKTIKTYEEQKKELEEITKLQEEFNKIMKMNPSITKKGSFDKRSKSEANIKFKEIFGDQFDGMTTDQIAKQLTDMYNSKKSNVDSAFKSISKSSIIYKDALRKSGGEELSQAFLDKYLNNVDRLNDSQKVLNQAKITTEELKQQIILSEQLKNNAQEVQDNLTNEQKDILKQIGIDPSSIQTVEELANAVEKVSEAGKITEEQKKQLINSFSDSTDNLHKAGVEIDDIKNKAESSASALEKVNSKLKQLFSFGTAAMLLRRTLTDAFNTIKDLDAAMTETAVVTDFTVGDMWEQLPEYTKMANELGVATKSAYEAATLYYQQGLSTNQVMELSNETLKMARIAGLDAADATDRMTNALRGFNMELNETSAQRIDDVYSELAAITAADVDEISVAMTKTASIASSAGMEFETTAAFLSQIIETTRESAETAGTALKTVIARFTELKKDPNSIVEVEGEEVDANKIETALRSIGVALRDEKGEFRDLDDVFLDVSKKWNTLTTNQQRYVATMAAGSRRNDCCPLLSAA